MNVSEQYFPYKVLKISVFYLVCGCMTFDFTTNMNLKYEIFNETLNFLLRTFWAF